MLRTRVLTAIVLLALLLPALFASAEWPFALLSLLLVAAAAWEWSRLNGVTPWAALGPGVLLGLAGAWAVHTGSVAAMPSLWWWCATAGWLLLGALVLRGGPAAWPRWPAVLRLLLGLLVLWTGWTALVQSRGVSVNFVLSALAIVWVADIGAYFTGRNFGRRKLAPSISPGKTWEGALGGAAAALLLALLWWSWIDRAGAAPTPSLFSTLHARGGLAWMLLATAALTALSVVGDLFESLVKRAAGAKDSSRLLPGHGGVLDRIDALLPVLPAALALRAL